MANDIVKRTDFQSVERSMQEAGFSPERVKQEISFALQIINKTPGLQECSRESLMAAVLNVSNIGISLNPAAKEAYLIPRWDSVTRGKVAVLEPSYVGLVKLLTDAGSVKSMVCQLVYENDKFTVDLADNTNPVKHYPELSRAKRGSVVGCYALATLADGTRQVEYMDISEIYEIRERSETYKAYTAGKVKSCTWVTDEGEMTRKTVVKRIYKYLPRTEKMDAVDKAIYYDNQEYVASEAQVNFIESLLETSTYEEPQRAHFRSELSNLSSVRASELIENLKRNQLDESQRSAFGSKIRIPIRENAEL